MSWLTSLSCTFASLYASLGRGPNRRRRKRTKATRDVSPRLLRIESLERRELLSVNLAGSQPIPVDEQTPPAIVGAPAPSQIAPATPANTHIDADLAQMIQAVQAAIDQGAPQDLSALSTAAIHVNSQGDIQVYVFVDAVASAEIQALQSAGLQVETSDADMQVVQGWASCSAIAQLDQTAGVDEICAPGYAIAQAGAADSAGGQLLQASNVRSQFAAYGIDGTGIKIGVISKTFASLFARLRIFENHCFGS